MSAIIKLKYCHRKFIDITGFGSQMEYHIRRTFTKHGSSEQMGCGQIWI